MKPKKSRTFVTFHLEGPWTHIYYCVIRFGSLLSLLSYHPQSYYVTCNRPEFLKFQIGSCIESSRIYIRPPNIQLSLLLSLFLVPLSIGSPSDDLYIKKLIADEAQILDAKDFPKLAGIFTKNATYNAGMPPTVFGVDSIKAVLAAILPPEVITQSTTSTESITLLPPFDEQGAAGTATGVVYITAACIGQGDLTGHALTFFAKYEDKYIKTGDFAHHGGWRISERFFVEFVSCSECSRVIADLERRFGHHVAFFDKLTNRFRSDYTGQASWLSRNSSTSSPSYAVVVNKFTHISSNRFSLIRKVFARGHSTCPYSGGGAVLGLIISAETIFYVQILLEFMSEPILRLHAWAI
ncbi:hypothetical protein MMC07_001491 [Pseudocyphellaria aurata]|nr:hypothetical protein [Pseudocyphellaria aurata]